MTDTPNPLRAALLAPVVILALCLAGCLAPVERPLPDDGVPIATDGPRAGSRQYLLSLADVADSIATDIDAGKIVASGQAFDAFHGGSDAAKKALNLSLGGYVDKINPPGKPPVANAWRTLAKEIRKAVAK